MGQILSGPKWHVKFAKMNQIPLEEYTKDTVQAAKNRPFFRTQSTISLYFNDLTKWHVGCY
jgi:hypothetical protein